MSQIAQAQGPWADLALHSMGWKAFQDLCSLVAEEKFKRPVQIHREAQDDGQDAVFLMPAGEGTKDATIQCKHSVDPARRLRLADLTLELKNVEALVAAGQADTYVLMTSMGMGARVAAEIKKALREMGVRKPHVWGKEYLVLAIRSSARLRAMVPQVYGLGDLSVILDQRLIAQTRALLDKWIPILDRYVPTSAHKRAVRALADHRVVLLLGNPSSGKSTIGAILSTVATDDSNVTVLKVDGPSEFTAAWQPHDKRRFFWIDDAFGSNVMRDDYVMNWTSAFVKMQAAMSQGNRFLLTSRLHIYEAAKRGLGGRNLPQFLDGSAVVHVGELSAEERSQILYNHVAFGRQPADWKRAVKDHLPHVADVSSFLPGVAERLGNPDFTKRIGTTRAELIAFMEKPRQHLIETVNDLEPALMAGLMLIYVHQGQFTSEDADDEASQAVSRMMDVPLSRILTQLQHLKGSFVHLARDSRRDTWTFVHPTIADALTTILETQPHMIDALVRGAKIETIIREFVCEDASDVADAAIIPTSLNDVLVERLSATKDDYLYNSTMFAFLADRSSDEVFKKTLSTNPSLLDRWSYSSYSVTSDAKLRAYARANRLGILHEERREWAWNRIERKAVEECDLSFLETEELAALIPPGRLLQLGFRLGSSILPNIGAVIEAVGDEADEDDPEGSFFVVSSGLRTMQEMDIDDDGTRTMIADARQQVSDAISDLQRRKAEREEDDSAEWDFMTPEAKAPAEEKTDERDDHRRSIFADVDQVREDAAPKPATENDSSATSRRRNEG